MAKCQLIAPLVAITLLAASRDAFAYRPFDGTDADVAETGAFELELGPLQYYRLGKNNYLITPGTTLNLGVIEDLEVVTDFKDYVGLQKVPHEARVRILETDALVKYVLRRGTLQGERGLSIAVEGGALLPEIQRDRSFGAQVNFIFSYRLPVGSIHFNEQSAFSRSQNLDLFSSIILEGPHDWRVRPVGEIFVEHEFNQGSTYSALLGGIWQARDSFAVDLGLRAARIAGLDLFEARLGFTWSIGIWEHGKTAVHD